MLASARGFNNFSHWKGTYRKTGVFFFQPLVAFDKDQYRISRRDPTFRRKLRQTREDARLFLTLPQTSPLLPS